jgi:hypothetical protein
MNVALTTTNTAPDVTAIERVERDAWLDLFAAVPAAYAISDSVLSRKLDACTLLAHKGIPISEFNRAFGICIDRPIAASDLDQIIEWLDANANSAWAIQLAPNKRLAEIETWLATHRLKPSGNGWAKFERMPFAASHPHGGPASAYTKSTLRRQTILASWWRVALGYRPRSRRGSPPWPDVRSGNAISHMTDRILWLAQPSTWTRAGPG